MHEILSIVETMEKQISRIAGVKVTISLNFNTQDSSPSFWFDIPNKQPLEQSIVKLTCEEYGITIHQLQSKSRIRKLIDARSVVCHLIHKHRNAKPERTAQILRRHRTEVLHLNKRITDLISVNDEIGDRVKKIEEKLLEQL
jgi:chromosomal replication initiation ATPase DnaA